MYVYSFQPSIIQHNVKSTCLLPPSIPSSLPWVNWNPETCLNSCIHKHVFGTYQCPHSKLFLGFWACFFTCINWNKKSLKWMMLRKNKTLVFKENTSTFNILRKYFVYLLLKAEMVQVSISYSIHVHTIKYKLYQSTRGGTYKKKY